MRIRRSTTWSTSPRRSSARYRQRSLSTAGRRQRCGCGTRLRLRGARQVRAHRPISRCLPGAEEKNLPVVVMPHWRTRGARRPRLRLVGPIPRFSRLRGVAAAIPRFNGLRPGGTLTRHNTNGACDAGRRHRRRASALIEQRHRRSEARLHRRLRATAVTPRSPARRSRRSCTPAP